MGDISGAQRFGFYLPTSHSVAGLSELAPPGGRLPRERLDVSRGHTVETGEEPHWPEDMDGQQFAAGLAGSALGYLGFSYRPGLPPFNSAYTLQEALTSREQHGEAQAAPALAPEGPGQRASSRGPVSNPAPRGQCCHLRRTVSLAPTAHPWSPQYHLCLSRLFGVSSSGEGRGREHQRPDSSCHLCL